MGQSAQAKRQPWRWSPARLFRAEKLRRIRAARRRGDHPWVSLLKALSWRFWACLDTAVLSFLMTGELSLAFSIMGAETLTKLGLYFVHERLWAQSTWKMRAGKDLPLRSLVKTLSWRATGTLDTVLLSWLITGDSHVAMGIGGLELLTKTVLYFFHERIWANLALRWRKSEEVV